MPQPVLASPDKMAASDYMRLKSKPIWAFTAAAVMTILAVFWYNVFWFESNPGPPGVQHQFGYQLFAGLGLLFFVLGVSQLNRSKRTSKQDESNKRPG